MKSTTLQTSYNSGDGIWFTSDTHFGHDNIIRYCQRPFENIDEMNETLIKNWNDRVQPNDLVFHLGDFAFGGSQLWNDMISRLNGRKVLILGNHDMKNIKEGYMSKFEWVGYQLQLQINGKSIYLNHYPFLCFGGAYRGEQATWQLFGHCHSKPGSKGLDVSRLSMCFPTQYDVGVDNNNYAPISFREVSDIINDQQMSLNLIRP